MFLDLETKELMDCAESLRVGGLDSDSATLSGLFEGVMNVPFQVLHHRDAIRNFVVHGQGV